MEMRTPVKNDFYLMYCVYAACTLLLSSAYYIFLYLLDYLGISETAMQIFTGVVGILSVWFGASLLLMAEKQVRQKSLSRDSYLYHELSYACVFTVIFACIIMLETLDFVK